MALLKLDWRIIQYTRETLSNQSVVISSGERDVFQIFQDTERGCISYNPNHSAKWTCHNLCYALCYLCMHCIWNGSLTNSIHVKTLDLLQVLVYVMKRVILVLLISCLLIVLLFLLPTPLRLPSQRPPLQRWNNFNVSNTLPEKLESSFLNSWWSERCQSQKYNIMVQNQIWRGFS